jgi:flavodoxin
MLVLAVILQNFDVTFDDPNYKPVVKQALTIKPGDLYIRVKPRAGTDATAVDHRIHSEVVKDVQTAPISVNGAQSEAKNPMAILYGSNTGTCQAFAQRLASEAGSRGFHAEVSDLDSATNAIPKGCPVVVITSSYEGQPPDNAARFIEWLSSCKPGSLTDVQYTVFGCGHRKYFATTVKQNVNTSQTTGVALFTVSRNSPINSWSKLAQSDSLPSVCQTPPRETCTETSKAGWIHLCGPIWHVKTQRKAIRSLKSKSPPVLGPRVSATTFT